MFKVQQEKIYQDYVSNKSKERSAQLEQYYEHTVTKLQAEVAGILQTVLNLQNLHYKQKLYFMNISATQNFELGTLIINKLNTWLGVLVGYFFFFWWTEMFGTY